MKHGLEQQTMWVIYAQYPSSIEWHPHGSFEKEDEAREQLQRDRESNRKTYTAEASPIIVLVKRVSNFEIVDPVPNAKL